MQIQNQIIYVIMTKDRKYIAKGTPRSRYLISVDDIKDKKRFLTYSSKGKAEAGFRDSGFYGYSASDDELEAVAVKSIMEIA